ncbi:MAG: VOC family protein [Anaerolineae bacterium]|nr:VOC family protein [Anaerolineae bacterium]
MAYTKGSILEHVAVRVKDLQWHIRFFEEALGMSVQSASGPADNPTQVWVQAAGGGGRVQIVAAQDFDGPEGRLVHLGITCDDLEAALDEVYKWGVSQLPQGRNWIKLPDGMEIELMQA